MLLFIGFSFSQSGFNGNWEGTGGFLKGYLKIYETSTGQYLDRYFENTFDKKSLSLSYSKEITNPWVGESYTVQKTVSKKYKDRYSYLILIDKNNLLYGDEKYTRTYRSLP